MGMIHWALIASTRDVHMAAYGWVMFVAVTLWLLTIALFFVSLFSINRMFSISWVLVVGELCCCVVGVSADRGPGPGPFTGSEES